MSDVAIIAISIIGSVFLDVTLGEFIKRRLHA